MYCNKSMLLLPVLFLCLVSAAQDIIIKTDKTEVRSKVTEITESSVKYKKWENLSGPTYSLSRNEVFMIMYANGQRESFRQTAPPPVSVPPTINNSSTPPTASKDLSGQINQMTAIDTAVDFRQIKIKYRPTRVFAGLQAPFSLGVDQEFRVLKNVLNAGTSLQYFFPKGDYILEQRFIFLYASAYAAVNRLSHNYSKQDEGLFVFGQLGYGATFFTTQDFFGNKENTSAGGITFRIGADYFFNKTVGISLSTYEFSTVYGGIVVNIL